MVEPLGTDLLSCALLHGLFHIVPVPVDKKTVDPDADLILWLLLELPLPVNGPAHEPGGIPAAYDASCDDPAAQGISPANLLDPLDDARIFRRERRGFPARAACIPAELLRSPEGRMLRGDVFPKAPASALPDLRIPRGRMGLIPVDRSLGAASIRHKDKVILRERDRLLSLRSLIFD